MGIGASGPGDGAARFNCGGGFACGVQCAWTHSSGDPRNGSIPMEETKPGNQARRLHYPNGSLALFPLKVKGSPTM